MQYRTIVTMNNVEIEVTPSMPQVFTNGAFGIKVELRPIEQDASSPVVNVPDSTAFRGTDDTKGGVGDDEADELQRLMKEVEKKDE